VSKGLGPMQKRILQIIWQERKSLKYSYFDRFGFFHLHNSDFIERVYDEDWINIDLIKKQRVYNSIKRLERSNWLEKRSGETVLKIYKGNIIDDDEIQNLKTKEWVPFKRLITC